MWAQAWDLGQLPIQQFKAAVRGGESDTASHNTATAMCSLGNDNNGTHQVGTYWVQGTVLCSYRLI